MVKTNIQTFTGEVEILSNLHVGDYLTANGDASNVLDVSGNVGATFFVGDGGLISNIATTLSDIVDQGNSVANVVQFNAPPAVYGGVGVITQSNVGIQNTNPLNTLSIADKIVIDKDVSEPSTTMNVHGKVYASRFEGDGGLLSNIATTLESIINQGNVSANVVQFNSATDYAGAGIITRSNVGIQNTAPDFNLSVGSNLHVNDQDSNVLVVHGNVAASNLNLGVFTVSPSHGLDQVCAESNLVTRPVRFSNVITAISAVSNIESAGTFISTDAERGIDVASNIDIGGRLKFDSNVFIDTLRVADVASNIVTYDRATGELTDSGGTFMNKFAVVSEQPPSDFFANTTTVTNHGTYTLTTSNLAANSNTFNAFDGTANAWVSGNDESSYRGGSNVFHQDNFTQLSNVHPTQFGDWLAIEFPYKTTLRHMKLTPLTAAQFPVSANLYATNNDITWSEIKYWKDVVPASDTAVQTITVDATEQFKKYALVATKSHDSSNVAIKDWQLFTESFSIDGGKVAMAQQAATGGETVVDQSGPHGRKTSTLKKYPQSDINVVLGQISSTEHFSHQHGPDAYSSFQHDPISNTYTQAGYTFSSSSIYNHAVQRLKGHSIMEAFDGDINLPGENRMGGYSTLGYTMHYASMATAYSVTEDSTGGYPYEEMTNNVTDADGNTYTGVEIKMGLPKKIKLESVDLYTWLSSGRKPWKGHVFASNTGANGSWIKIQDFNNLFKQNGENAGLGNQTGLAYDHKNVSVNGTQYYSWYSIVVTHLNGPDRLLNLFEIEFNGYEQDQPDGDISVDTTFKSVMNTPQTLGTNVYVDGDLGETFTNRVPGLLDSNISNTHTTYVSADKYWELSGNVESNVTVESNTFLHGDNPHAISMWVNSSNLEANVSNSCIFSYNVGVTGKTLDCIVNHDTTNYHHFYYPEDRVEASDRQENDKLGEFGAVGISADGNFMVIGARNEDDGNTGAGAAYVYKKVGNKWLQEQKLQAGITANPTDNADRGYDDNFGKSVAISGDGKTIAVGAINDDEDATNQGAVYVFVRDDSTESWSQQTKIGPTGTLADTGSNRYFGWDVSLSYDGSRLAVGEQYGDTGATDAGSAWVFDRTGTSWNTGQRLDRSDSSGATSTYYGASIAISGNGNYIVVGSHYMTSQQGRAYVWVRNTSNNTWSQQQILSASDATNNTQFGIDVDIDDSGTYIIVGAWLRDEVATNSGNAYIFFRSGSGSNPWTQQAELVNPEPTQDDYFAQRVAISGDGKYVAVGVELDDDGVRGTNVAHEGSASITNSGSIYTYSRSGTTWTTVNKLRAGDNYTDDRFGAGVSLSGDGKYLATVAYMNWISTDNNGVGWVYVLSNERTMHNKPMLELQPNTWHNITYSYEGGEGGSRITYLDGRKVSDDRIHDSTRRFPPFEMTNWEQGGYKVTCSGIQAPSSAAAYQAFQRSYYWYSEPGTGDPGSSYLDQNARPLSKGGHPSTAVTDTAGTTHVGHWVQLECPFKIYVDWLWVKGGEAASSYYTHNPDNYVILGSNDNVNFDLLATRTNASNGTSGMTLGIAGAPGSLTNADKCVVNAQKAYKYIRFLCTKIGDANGTRELIIQELRYFGHAEGDEIEFPDPNTVRAYPPPGRFKDSLHFRSNTNGYHEDCDRGYVVSASTKYAATTDADAWRAFQGYVSNSTGGASWDTATGTYAGPHDGTLDGRASTGTTTFNSRNGEWINVKFPYKVKLTAYQHWTRMNRDHEGPYSGYLYGSNDGFNTFQEIQRFSAITLPTDTRGVTYRHDVSASYTPDGGSAVALIPYNEYRLQVTHTQAGTYLNIAKLEFYGTADESISVPIQLGGGNINKIANFRIYDKALNEDEVMEIWDSQKDQFERSKTSMTLHKGRLGIGTTEPIGRLSVLDENYELEKFPPRPMIRGGTYMDGHGVFVTRASTEFDNYNLSSWRVHAGNTNDVNSRWRSASSTYTNNGPGGCIPSASAAILTGTRVRGEYVITEMPYKICLKRYEHEGYLSQSPKEGQIWGSNDGLSWSHIHTFTNGGVPIEDHREVGNQPKITNYVHGNTKYYSRYAFIVTMINGLLDNGDDAVGISDISYFGIRERGQSTLDDGNLSITKKLDVSTIGPISDKVKELTPHREDLICEYITSTNPFRNKVLIDTSGKGNDGIQHLGNYQPEWKAINAGGSATTYDSGPAARIGSNPSTDNLNDFGSFETVLPQLKGNPKMTVSWWMRIASKPSGSNLYLAWLLGRNDRVDTTPVANGQMHWFGLDQNGQPRVALGGGGNLNLYYGNGNVNHDIWYHCCVVINPTHGNSGVGAGDVTLYITRENDENPYGHNVARAKDGSSQLSAKSAVLPLSTTSTSGSSGVIDLGGSFTEPRMHWGWQEKPDVFFPGWIAQPKVWNRALTRHEVQSVYDLGRHDQGLSVVNFSKTAVGVGLGDGVIPRGLLDVRGDASMHGRLYMKGVEAEVVMDASSSGKWKMAALGGGTGELKFHHYHYDGSGYRQWHERGKLVWNGTAQMNFTGQHKTFIDGVPFSEASDVEGLIVSSNKNKYIKMTGGIEAGANAITTNESLPLVSLSNVVADKKCFGVISLAEDPDKREETVGNFVSVFDKENGDTRVFINSVGEGAIWVVNTNGSLEAGDYITTSNITGYGQKQDDDILHNYSVAKITMDCDFNPATQPVQQILRSNVTETYYLANVHHIKPTSSELMTTIVTADDEWSDVSIYPSDVTYAEWSNLEPNRQNTYNLSYTQTSNLVYDTKYTLTTTTNVTETDSWDRVTIIPPNVNYAEWSNLEANTQNTYTITFTQTTTDTKTPEEWSALESNTQSLYNKVYYQSVEEEVSAGYPGAVAHTRVTDRIENDLDAHGQIQWENHPTETEKAYKLRYLTADGTQTDEANAVHIAAFVGCTYHCG